MLSHDDRIRNTILQHTTHTTQKGVVRNPATSETPLCFPQVTTEMLVKALAQKGVARDAIQLKPFVTVGTQ